MEASLASFTEKRPNTPPAPPLLYCLEIKIIKTTLKTAIDKSNKKCTSAPYLFSAIACIINDAPTNANMNKANG